MVARIAPEPLSTSVAVAGYRAARNGYADARPDLAALEDNPLPPVPAPVPTPVPTPAIVPPGEAFAAALLAEQMPMRAVSPDEVRLRLAGNGWQAPASSLRLADRKV